MLLSLIFTEVSESGVFDNILPNTADSFFGNNLYVHLSAVGFTYFSIYTGMDAGVSSYFNNRQAMYDAALYPGTIWGTAAPFVIGGGLYALGGFGKGNKDILGASYAVLQASLINIATNTMFKVITNRAVPDPSQGNLREQSQTFHLGFMTNGMSSILNGWPSGHVSAAAAIAGALMSYYPNDFWVHAYGYLSMGYMLLTVSAYDGGRYHWFSDGVAGLLMGYTIGTTVGTNFRYGQRYRNSYTLLPVATTQFAGLFFSMEL